YKLIPQELKFYSHQNLPLPLLCPTCRHHARLAKRNPHKNFDRTCAKCAAPIKTTYSPKAPEIVYCEKCYLDTIHT
ncbi:MAG: hypothetical protein V1679_03045, partial [Candidatus Peregrinibacteria bacterium]